MAFGVAKVGLLGSSTNTTLGLHTVYTVPAGRTAKIRLMFGFEGGGAGGGDVEVRVNEHNVLAIQHGSNNDSWSGVAVSTGDYDVSAIIINGNKPASVDLNSATDMNAFVAELPVDYYLDENDTVQIEISTAALDDAYIAVHGTEFTT